MRLSTQLPREKLYRRLDARLTPARALSRIALSRADAPVGRRRGNRFWFYFPEKGLFSLFAPTLYGTIRQDGSLDITLSRSRPLLALWLLWCGFLLFTGLQLLPAEWDFALWFLLPGALLLLPAFHLGKGKKARLLTEVKTLCARPGQQEA